MSRLMTHYEQVQPGIVILKKQADGCFYWVGAEKDVESARCRVRALMEFFPAEYVILDQKIGKRIAIRPAKG